MSNAGYTLTWRSRDGAQPIDGSALRPDTLGKLDADALAATTLPVGRVTRTLGELFDIEGNAGETLTLKGMPLLDRLGAQMTDGTLIIEGDAGDDLGASMAGGVIRVTDNAGGRVGGPEQGSYRGMTGGEIHIAGNVGDYAGFRMRRGVIAIAGAAGASPGYRMTAGTILVAKGPYDAPGLEMRRGTIICLDRDQPVLTGGQGDVGFGVEGVFDSAELPAIRFTLRQLQRTGCEAISDDAVAGRYCLMTGDRFELNKGEIWQWVY